MARKSTNDSDTVIAEFLSRKKRDVIVTPPDLLIVVRDGVFTGDGSLGQAAEWDVIRTEGKHVLRRRGIFASQHNIRALLASGSPHSLNFWTDAPHEIDLSESGGHSVPVLSKDGVVIPMQVTVIVAIDPDNATRLFRLTRLRTTGTFTTDDLQKMLRTEVMANVIAPVIESYESSDIRGNEEVRGDLQARLCDTFESYLKWYGIGLAGNKLAVQWGLTEADAYRIKAQRVAAEPAFPRILSRVLKALLLLLHSLATRPVKTPVVIKAGGNVDYKSNSGLNGIWIVLLVGVVVAAMVAIVYLFTQ